MFNELSENKIIYENFRSGQRDLDLQLRQFQCGCYYMIQYSIYDNFSVFCKKINLEIENILKIDPTKFILSIKKIYGLKEGLH